MVSYEGGVKTLGRVMYVSKRVSSSWRKAGETLTRAFHGAGVSRRKESRLIADESRGGMIGEGCTKAYSCPAKEYSVKTHCDTFLLTANLALICGLFFFFPRCLFP